MEFGRWTARAIAALFLSVIWSCSANAQPLVPPPVKAYAQEHSLRSISMSPDGRTLAFVKRNENDEFTLFISDITGNGRGLYAIKEEAGYQLTEVRWVANDRLVFTLRARTEIYGIKVAYTRLLAMNPDGGNMISLMAKNRRLRSNFNLSTIASTLPRDDDHILVVAYDSAPALYKVNIYDGKAKRAYRGRSNTIAWTMDQNGLPRLRYDFSRFSETIKVYANESDSKRWQRILKIKLSDVEDDISLRGAGLTTDGDILVLDRKGTEEFVGLHKYDIEQDRISDTLYAVDGFDLNDTITDAYTGAVLGAEYIDDRPRHVYFEPLLQEVQNILEKQFPNGLVSIQSVSQDRDRFLVYVGEPWSPGSYYVYDHAGKSAKLVSHVSELLGRVPYTAVDVIEYQTSDGTRIKGYLTFPVGADPIQLPMIVYPHGGPHSRDWLTYDPFAQYWASRGYVVFQPNFRGSIGYGRAFEEAGYREYGDKVIGDIASGIRAIIKAQYADPYRICAAGFSFGGYAALALAAAEPDLIKCAVSINGVTDWPLLIRTKLDGVEDRETRQELKDYYDRRVGNIDTEEAMLKSISPAHNPKSIRVPVLLIHAEDDKNVDISQSEVMHQALSDLGKTVKFERLPQGGHSLRRANAWRTVLRQTEAFIDYEFRF